MLRDAVYPKVEKLLNQTASFLLSKGITANQLTVGGAVVNLLAGLIYAHGAFFLGGLVLLIAGLGDLLDGPVARLSKSASPKGAFLDSCVDRYSDFFVFAGLALFYAKNQAGWFLLCMGIILGSFVTSYAKARAENFIEKSFTGIFERAERVLLLALGSLLPFLMPLVLWILFLGTNFTAAQRVYHNYRQMKRSQG